MSVRFLSSNNTQLHWPGADNNSGVFKPINAAFFAAIWMSLDPATWDLATANRPIFWRSASRSTSSAAAGGTDSAFRVRTTRQMRGQRLRAGANTTQDAFPSGGEFPSLVVPGNTAVLGFYGLANQGTAQAPVWRAFVGYVPAGGQPQWEFDALEAGVDFAPTSIRVVNAIGACFGTPATPANTRFEHFALIEGNLWHNNAFDTEALERLAGFSAAGVPWDYEDAAQARGWTIQDWRRLSTISDLENLVNPNDPPLVIFTSDTNPARIETAPALAPAHWSGQEALSINERLNGFVFGGRGSRQLGFAGEYVGTTPAGIQYRVEALVSSNWQVVPGFDWRAPVASTIGGNVWSITTHAVPEGGEYRLRVRRSDQQAIEATSVNRWRVGVVMAVFSQSNWNHIVGLNQNSNTEDNFQPEVPQPGGLNLIVDVDKNGQPQTAPRSSLADTATAPNQVIGVVPFFRGWRENAGNVPLMLVVHATSGQGLQATINNVDLGATNPGPWKVTGDGVDPTSGMHTFLAHQVEKYADYLILNWWADPSSDAAHAAQTDAFFDVIRNNSDAIYTQGPREVVVMGYMRSHQRIPHSSAATEQRRLIQYAQARNFQLLPRLWDLRVDGNGSSHARKSETGAARGGHSLGRQLAWLVSKSAATFGPIPARAFFNAARTQITLYCGRTLTTDDTTNIANEFFISVDNGNTFVRNTDTTNGGTITIDRDKIICTKFSGSWPASNVRVDWLRGIPYNSSSTTDGAEVDAPAYFSRCLFDSSTAAYGGTGIPMEMAPTGTGIPVTANDGLGPRLDLATRLPPGTYPVTIRRLDVSPPIDRTFQIVVGP